MPIVEQELLNLPGHLGLTVDFECDSYYLIFRFMCSNVLLSVVFHFVPFRVAIVLHVLHRFTGSDYPFGIFILFFLVNLKISNPSTCQELLFNWSIYLTFLHTIGRQKMKERLHDMNTNEMLFTYRC